MAEHELIGRYVLAASAASDGGEPRWLFTDNETNTERLWGIPNRTPWTKDAFHAYVVEARREAVNAAGEDTKAAALYRLALSAGEEVELRLRLSRDGAGRDLGAGFDEVFRRRIAEADQDALDRLPSMRARVEKLFARHPRLAEASSLREVTGPALILCWHARCQARCS